MSLPTIITDNGVSVFVNDTMHTIGRDHPNFFRILSAIKEQRWDDVAPLLDIAAFINEWSVDHPDFRVQDGLVYYKDDAFSDTISKKVIRMINEGQPALPLLRFLEKLRANPSATAQNELLLFCEANKFMIHEDGDILAYKSVRANYKDIHSGRNDNSIGNTVEMPRFRVNDDRSVTCSFGLHFAALEYARDVFTGAHLMVLKLNPRDVVSIPHDYNNQKGRCCRYEVIGEVKNARPLPEREVYREADLSRYRDGDEGDYCDNCGESDEEVGFIGSDGLCDTCRAENEETCDNCGGPESDVGLLNDEGLCSECAAELAEDEDTGEDEGDSPNRRSWWKWD